MAALSSTTAEEDRVRAAYARRPRSDPRYSWFRPAYLLENHERERRVLARLAQHGFSSLATARILEIGCGTGHWIREHIKWGARPENITGIELIPERVEEARILCPPGVQLICGSAVEVASADEAFDLVIQSTVFSSIVDTPTRQRIASEMLRVVKCDGLIVWYDFLIDNPANRDVRGVTKRDIRQLFPQCQIELQRITLAPPVARALAPYSWIACQVLGRMPWLCTHYLGLIQKGRVHT